jgi:hypothetical protein
VGEHEGRCVERRIRPPPALPVPVVLPAGRTELVGAHDLGADATTVLLGERVVDSTGSACAPEPGSEQPLVQTLARMAERGIGRLRFAGGEAVERYGQVWIRVSDIRHTPRLMIVRLQPGSRKIDQGQRRFWSSELASRAR